jgi:hypothetical protein
MRTMTYPEVLQVAQQLPPDSQLALAETLLHHVRTLLSGQGGQAAEDGLKPLVGFNHEELQTLAGAVVAADRQQELQTLLDKNRQGSLTAQEQQRLDALLDEADQVALLKARALYTLQLCEASIAVTS